MAILTLQNNDDGASGIGQGAGLYIQNADVSMNQVAITNNTIFNAKILLLLEYLQVEQVYLQKEAI